MGYELHITRRTHWNEEGPEIDRELWRRIVDEDPELELEADDGARWMNSVAPGMGDVPLYWDTSGNIVAKNPDQAARVKMYRLAQMLGAKVQGDDGEVYDAEGNAPSSSRGGLFFFLFIAMVLLFILYLFVTSPPQPH
jgi:hypothetical protein